MGDNKIFVKVGRNGVVNSIQFAEVIDSIVVFPFFEHLIRFLSVA